VNNHKSVTDLDHNKMLKSNFRAVQSTSSVHNFKVFVVMAAGFQHFVRWRSKIETYRELFSVERARFL